MSIKISWGKFSAGNMGKVEGTDYRCERYWLTRSDGVKQYWYLLADSKFTYLCSKGPFKSPQERDEHILTEVKERVNGV